MDQQCVIVNVLSPANIISTDLVTDQQSCVWLCSIQVTVTWENTGDIADTFIPSITIDSGEPIVLDAEELAGGDTISHMFTVSNLTIGTHTIQASPAGVSPKTMEIIEPPIMEAGFSEQERFLIVGLLFGLASKAIEKLKKMSKEKI